MIKDLPIESLTKRIAGRVILPADSEYDGARMVFMGDIDKHPAVIVRVANATDIGTAIEFARANDLELAVRSGGHSIHGTSEGGLVIDLRDMNKITFDSESGTAWAETG